VSSLFYILFSKHYISSRKYSNIYPPGYETELSPQTKNPYCLDLRYTSFYMTLAKHDQG